MNSLARFRYFLWIFSRFKVPMMGYLKPKLVSVDTHEIVIKIPLTRRSKNHLGSLYFAALAAGADIAGGLHGFYHAKQAKTKISLAFKSFQANFVRRPEQDVYFVCSDGLEVQKMIETSKQTGERINRKREVQAYINYPKQKELVAEFVLELSIKVLEKNRQIA